MRESLCPVRDRTRKDSGPVKGADTDTSSTGQAPCAKVLNRRRLSSPTIGLPSSFKTTTLRPQTRKLH
ncbi:MAG: hypothetical protein ACXVAA_11470, partial [Candidatus Binataceae bacterium]